MKISRLPGRKNVARVQKSGSMWRGKTMNIRHLPGTPRHPLLDPKKSAVYVGVLTPAKLHKSAVKRNRMRRRCREALRTALQEYDTFSTVQLLLSPKIASLDCDYGDIKKDIASFLSIFS